MMPKDKNEVVNNEACVNNDNDEGRVFILRWKPEISNISIELYNQIREESDPTLCWKIRDWQEAHEGDKIVMICEGTENPGIVFHGKLLEEPIECESWGNEHEMKHDALISVESAVNPNQGALVPLDELAAKIPDFNWRCGHSGELLTQEQSRKLREIMPL